MKNKKIYGFVLLALIIMLLPLGMVSAKYKQTKEVGKVTLDIAPPILSPTWYYRFSKNDTIKELIVDSFTPEANPDTYSNLGLKWEEGKPVGYDPDSSNNFKGQVRLFEQNDTAYILAEGKNPVIFPENSMCLFANWTISEGTDKIIFNNIDTSKVNNMAMMFAGSSSITSLEFGNNFDTSKVINMSNMFNGCSGLTSLNVSDFNTSSVTNMDNMFNSCRGLTTLNLNNFNTSKVENMSTMFFNCKELTSLDLSSFNTEYVTNMSSMFGGCNALTALNISIFNTTNVTDMGSMFSDCSSLTSLDLSSFNTQRVTNMSTMFKSCKNLTTIYAGNSWNVDNVNNSNNMFSGCNNLVGGASTPYSSSFVDKTYAKIDGGTTNPGYLTSITDKPSTTSNIFSLVQEGGTIIGTQTTNSEEE